MRRWKVIVFVALALAVVTGSTAGAGEIDLLVNKLVEKGILTPGEAQELLEETKKEAAQEIAKEESPSLPQWVQSTKIKGDFRLRYQYQRQNTDADAQTRGRIRYRLGVESKVNDKTKVAFGLASGGSDPRSTNQTFQDTFSSKGVNLDYAFVEYAPAHWAKLIGGKFVRKDYLWEATDLMWDGDINPEGGSAHFHGSLASNLDYWGNLGIWVLDENGRSDSPDPFMKYLQGGVSFHEGMLDAKLAVTGYGFTGVEGHSLDNNSGTNSGSTTALRSNYRTLSVASEVGFNEPFGGLPFHMDERVAFLGDFVRNLDNDKIKEDLTGHAFGIKFGNKKLEDFGQWQFRYIKAKLGRDAWIDAFPDSDRLGGKTDVESHKMVFNYGLVKNIVLGLTYYKSWSLSTPNDKDHLLQADLLFKF